MRIVWSSFGRALGGEGGPPRSEPPRMRTLSRLPDLASMKMTSTVSSRYHTVPSYLSRNSYTWTGLMVRGGREAVRDVSGNEFTVGLATLTETTIMAPCFLCRLFC